MLGGRIAAAAVHGAGGCMLLTPHGATDGAPPKVARAAAKDSGTVGGVGAGADAGVAAVSRAAKGAKGSIAASSPSCGTHGAERSSLAAE